jgi:iron complex outermembrane receptor protein
LFAQVGAEEAHLFANAIDTKSDGLSFVLDNNIHLGPESTLKNSLAGTFSKTIQVGKIHASKILAASGQTTTYFDRTSKVYLEDAVPHTKILLSNMFRLNKFTVFLRNNYFGKVQNPTSNVKYYQTYSGKVITDLSLGYNFSKHLNLTIGANNLFDVYPDENIVANQSSGRFIYPRGAIQFGFGGRFVFARLLAHL